MNRFSVDYSDLQSKLTQKKAYRLSEVQSKIKKVAFDVVRFVDSDRIDDLWQIQSDGENEYIVAMYDDNSPDEAKIITAACVWTAVADSSKENVNVFYKNTPVSRIALASMGIESSDAHLVCKSLSNKLANDYDFRSNFIANLTDSERTSLLKDDPSLLGK